MKAESRTEIGSRGCSGISLRRFLHLGFAVRSPLKRLRNRDRMWECRTAHTHSDIPHLVRASPRHPASVRKCSMWLPVLFRFLVDSLATLGHRLAASGMITRMLSGSSVFFFCSGVVCSCSGRGTGRYAGWWAFGGNRQTPPPPREECTGGERYAVRYAGRSRAHRHRNEPMVERSFACSRVYAASFRPTCWHWSQNCAQGQTPI